jgi:hypothetical protein
MPVRDAGRRSGCACETAPGASADVRRRKPSGVAVANPPQTGCSRPLSTSTEGKASRRPGELRSDLLGEKSGLKAHGYHSLASFTRHFPDDARDLRFGPSSGRLPHHPTMALRPAGGPPPRHVSSPSPGPHVVMKPQNGAAPDRVYPPDILSHIHAISQRFHSGILGSCGRRWTLFPVSHISGDCIGIP